jgi:flagellar biosynthesis protein FlhA
MGEVAMEGFFGKFKALTQNSDVVLAVGLMIVLGVMVVPIPPIMLDMFLALSIALSIAVLLTAVYSKRPLDFSTFPTVLLITTLFRLSLNVASTRNILLNGASDGTGAAGQIIKAFGDFVVGGNYAVLVE